MRVVLVDTGPLVALFNKRDTHHTWARHAFETNADPLLTCDAVLAAACHLLKARPDICVALLAAVERGTVRSSFVLSEHAPRIRWLMNQYTSVPMSFADACLVRMTEIHSNVVVWTIDSDFSIYRRHGRQRIPTLMPR